MNKLDFVRSIEGLSDTERFDRISAWLTAHEISFQTHAYDTPDRGVNLIIPAAGGAGKEILAVAHYDTFYFSPGANDNASAVAVLLDFCLDLRGRTLRHPLKIILFDDEEPAAEKNWMGMRGSRAYVKTFGTRDILAVYDFEMCGMGDAIGIWPVTAFNEKSFLLDNIRSVLADEGIYYEMVGTLPAFYADYHAFHEAGFPHAVCLTAVPRADAERLRSFVTAPRWKLLRNVFLSKIPGLHDRIPTLFRHYHTPADRSEYLSEDSMEMVKTVLTRCVLKLDAAAPI